MPCVSGRAQHILCKPDCSGEDPCSCRVRNAYSCRTPFCCGEDRLNTQLSLEDARDSMCIHIGGDGVSDGVVAGALPYASVDELRDAICGTIGSPPPYFNCPMEVTIAGAALGAGVSGPTGAVGPFDVAVISKGACTGDSTDALEIGANVVYNIFIDGFECTSFENA